MKRVATVRRKRKLVHVYKVKDWYQIRATFPYDENSKLHTSYKFNTLEELRKKLYSKIAFNYKDFKILDDELILFI